MQSNLQTALPPHAAAPSPLAPTSSLGHQIPISCKPPMKGTHIMRPATWTTSSSSRTCQHKPLTFTLTQACTDLHTYTYTSPPHARALTPTPSRTPHLHAHTSRCHHCAAGLHHSGIVLAQSRKVQVAQVRWLQLHGQPQRSLKGGAVQGIRNGSGRLPAGVGAWGVRGMMRRREGVGV